MKNTLLSLFFVACFSLVLSAQDEVRQLSDFSSVSVSGGITVDLIHGSPKAEIDIVKGELDKLRTEVKGDHLKIYFENKWGYNSGKRKANIDLYFENLDEISVSAGARVECNETIKSSDFEVDASSGASLEVKVEAGDVESDVSSGASVYLHGKAKSLNVDVSSGASFKGSGLETAKVNADVSSGGNIKVWATKSLEADASSGGSISYKGNPEKTSIDAGKWSGGSIRKM